MNMDLDWIIFELNMVDIAKLLKLDWNLVCLLFLFF